MPNDYVKETLNLLSEIAFETVHLRPHEFMVVGCFADSRLFFHKQMLLPMPDDSGFMSVAERLSQYGYFVAREEIDVEQE